MAANTISIVSEFLQMYPKIRTALSVGDDKTSIELLGRIQHAYFYALGMNEGVVDLADTSDDAGIISGLLRHLQGQQDAVSREYYEREFLSKTHERWHNILRKYHWQQGMSADTIHREGNWILNDAARMGNRVWKSVSQAFFTQGPDVASARLADFKSRSKSASTELERQWGKIGRGEGDEYLKARSTARDLLHGAENAVDSASSALWDLVKVVEGLGGKSEPLLRQQAAALPKMRYAIWTIRQTLR